MDALSYSQLESRYERLIESTGGLERTDGSTSIPGGVNTYSGYAYFFVRLPSGRDEEFMAKIDVVIDFTPDVRDRVVISNIVGRNVGNVIGTVQSDNGITFSLLTPGFTNLRFNAANLAGELNNPEFSGVFWGQAFGEFYGATPKLIDGYFPSTRLTIDGVDTVVVGKFRVISD